MRSLEPYTKVQVFAHDKNRIANRPHVFCRRVLGDTGSETSEWDGGEVVCFEEEDVVPISLKEYIQALPNSETDYGIHTSKSPCAGWLRCLFPRVILLNVRRSIKSFVMTILKIFPFTGASLEMPLFSQDG